VRAIDVRHLGRERVICCWEVDGVLVDPGPESAVETLLEALGGEAPRALALTHIHFDHAGAAGALVRRFPGLEVYVHSRGARHLADPGRLVASATRLYGEEGMRELWGEVVPVPTGSLRALEGGETVLGGWRVEYTPGHASHHVCYLHEPSGWAFTGDVAGVHMPGVGAVVAPTPPPDIDLEAWERSLQVVSGWDPVALGLTHFGAVEEDVQAHLGAVDEALRREAAWAAEHDLAGFTAAFGHWLRAQEGDEATVAAFLQAAPPEHLYLGLERWLESAGGRPDDEASPGRVVDH
jgi:glyoxylase-like metal-dependent hydrolase (beta-lactamase superfamily II)